MQWIEDIVKLAIEDGHPIALLHENGADCFYKLVKMSKSEKGELLGVQIAERIKK
jgi:hypothetical protein